MTKEKLFKNRKVVKDFCEKYRKELTVYQALVCKKLYGMNPEDYIEFMNDLSMDEFIGNNLTALMQDTVINWFIETLAGRMTFEDIVTDDISGMDIDEYRELLAKTE